MRPGIGMRKWLAPGFAAFMLAGSPALAQSADEMVLENAQAPDAPATPAPAGPGKRQTAPATPEGQAVGQAGQEVVQPLPVLEPVMHWDVADAQALLDVIDGIGAEGLFPADYKPDVLREALAAKRGAPLAAGGKKLAAGPANPLAAKSDKELAASPGQAPTASPGKVLAAGQAQSPDAAGNDALDEAASKSFAWLAEDLRDGRTPMTARVQWFAVDPDQDRMPTAQLMAQALTNHDVAGVLASLAPTNPDYAALKEELAATPETEMDRRALIRANMDRWRWLARDLGEFYLLTNVPEFQLRLTVKNRNIRTYRTVVGKPGRTATPQLAETVTAVVFNPTWTVPQSIVKGEGLGARLLSNPAEARREGYKVSRGADGYVSVVQQPGPGNALGLMKIDMPNPHAIYLHDTPSKQYFQRDVRAFSHGCIRTERAVELGMTMAILGANMPKEEAAAISRSRQYTKVPMTRTFPVYITYFTMARDIDGSLREFGDIYGRDKPVLDSFAAPRQPKTSQRQSDEPIIELDNPL
jgi:murein L,D-transpeptidase YcbB/YkuD